MLRFYYFAVLFLLLGLKSYAENRNLSSPTPSSSIRHTIEDKSIFFREIPDYYRNRADYIYDTYFRELDSRFALEYKDRWSYNDHVRSYESSADRLHNIQSVGTLTQPTQQIESREDFAKMVLRVRFEHFLFKTLSQTRWFQQVENLRRQVSEMTQFSTPVSSDPQTPASSQTSFRAGYDIFSDNTSMELDSPVCLAGLYHPNFLRSLAGSRSDSFEVRVSKELESKWIPSMKYTFNGDLGTGVSKALSPTLGMELQYLYPLHSRSPQQLGFLVTWQF